MGKRSGLAAFAVGAALVAFGAVLFATAPASMVYISSAGPMTTWFDETLTVVTVRSAIAAISILLGLVLLSYLVGARRRQRDAAGAD